MSKIIKENGDLWPAMDEVMKARRHYQELYGKK